MRKFIYFGQGMCPENVEGLLKQNKIQVDTDIEQIGEEDVDKKHRNQISFFKELGATSVCFENLGEEIMVTVEFETVTKFDNYALNRLREMIKDDIRDVAIDNAGSKDRKFNITYCYSVA